jgi:hypothetical protein
MASSTQDRLYNLFASIFGGQGFDLSSMIQTLSGTGGSAAGTQAGGGGAGSIATTVLKSAFGVIPLVSGLLGLFGGGDSPAPPPLVKYSLPAPIAFEAADTPSGLAMVDYGQSGTPRAYEPQMQPAATGSQARQAAPPPQITVNVQAMDARSFLDRSSDIAAAVREAMLNLNSINDVVNDL